VSLRWIVFASALAAAHGCDKDARGGSQSPGDRGGALERMEGRAGDSGAQEGAQPDAKAGQALPRVRDRDPEEERRKMAQSRSKSDQAKAQLRAGQLDLAVRESREALRIHEQNVDAMLVIAEVFYRQSKYELTLAVTNTALAVDAKVRTPQQTSSAHNLRGFAHAAMGNDQAATEAFKKAAETDDKSAAAWNNLGTRYLDAGDAKTALSCFTYALELQPGFAKAHLNLGAAYRAQGKWTDAEASFQSALRLRKNYPEAHFNLGLLYLDADPFPGLDTQARLNKAISHLESYKNASAPPDAARAAEPGRTRIVRGRPGAKPGPPPVSTARADDYIRIARKGIDREQRRVERESERKATGPAGPAAGGASETSATASGTEADAAAPTPKSPAQRPGTRPADSPPEASPPKPEPSDPSPEPPDPGPPAKPSAPQSPAPQKPTLQKPGQPPQKSSAAGNPREEGDTKAPGHAAPPRRDAVVLPTLRRGHEGAPFAPRRVTP
jgi:tetratricopeptide (TPR) repeat protein